MRKIKTGDKVLVIAGKHRGKIAPVLQVKDKENVRGITNTYVYLEGVNVAKKAVKKQWFKEIILPIHVSNVKYYDESAKKASKVSFVIKDGKKCRSLRDTGKILEK